MTDRFSTFAASVDAPASHAFAITPSNGTDLSDVTRGLYCGIGGDIAVVMLSGQTVTFSQAPGGAILPLRVSRVLATGTTASALVGLL
jgi:hypothetical protein